MNNFVTRNLNLRLLRTNFAGLVNSKRKTSISLGTEMTTPCIALFSVRILLNALHGLCAHTLMHRMHTLSRHFMALKSSRLSWRQHIFHRADAVVFAKRLTDIYVVFVFVNVRLWLLSSPIPSVYLWDRHFDYASFTLNTMRTFTHKALQTQSAFNPVPYPYLLLRYLHFRLSLFISLIQLFNPSNDVPWTPVLLRPPCANSSRLIRNLLLGIPFTIALPLLTVDQLIPNLSDAPSTNSHLKRSIRRQSHTLMYI